MPGKLKFGVCSKGKSSTFKSLAAATKAARSAAKRNGWANIREMDGEGSPCSPMHGTTVATCNKTGCKLYEGLSAYSLGGKRRKRAKKKRKGLGRTKQTAKKTLSGWASHRRMRGERS